MPHPCEPSNQVSSSQKTPAKAINEQGLKERRATENATERGTQIGKCRWVEPARPRSRRPAKDKELQKACSTKMPIQSPAKGDPHTPALTERSSSSKRSLVPSSYLFSKTYWQMSFCESL